MKTSISRMIVGIAAVVCLARGICYGQTYSIDWFKVAGGGGTSSGGAYGVSGTIGQTDAGAVMLGSSYALTGGFWSFASAVQLGRSPALFVDYTAGTVTIHWQAQSGWVLQENQSLNNPSGWTNSLELVTVNGISYHTVGNPVGALFFRLKR